MARPDIGWPEARGKARGLLRTLAVALLAILAGGGVGALLGGDETGALLGALVAAALCIVVLAAALSLVDLDGGSA